MDSFIQMDYQKDLHKFQTLNQLPPKIISDTEMDQLFDSEQGLSYYQTHQTNNQLQILYHEKYPQNRTNSYQQIDKEFQLQEERNMIDQQNIMLHNTFTLIINNESIDNISRIQETILKLGQGSIESNMKQALDRVYQNIENQLKQHLKTFSLSKIQQTFSLLKQQDKDYEILLSKLLKQIFEDMVYNVDRLKLDMCLYFLKGNQAKNETFLFPSKWVYCNSNKIKQLLKRVSDLVEQQNTDFLRSPFEEALKDISLDSDFFNQAETKLQEYTTIHLTHSIRNTIIIGTLQFRTEEKNYLLSLINEFMKELNKTKQYSTQEELSILMIYKKIQNLYKKIFEEEINNFDRNIHNQLHSTIHDVIQYVNESPEAVEINKIQDELIIFINEIYLDKQIKIHMLKIKNILGELQRQKKNNTNKVFNKQSLAEKQQEVLCLVPQNLKAAFFEILTEDTVKNLQSFVKKYKSSNEAKDIMQQKQLTLLMCQQIGSALYSTDFKPPQHSSSQQKIPLQSSNQKRGQTNDSYQQLPSSTQMATSLNQFSSPIKFKQEEENLKGKQTSNQNLDLSRQVLNNDHKYEQNLEKNRISNQFNEQDDHEFEESKSSAVAFEINENSTQSNTLSDQYSKNNQNQFIFQSNNRPIQQKQNLSETNSMKKIPSIQNEGYEYQQQSQSNQQMEITIRKGSGMHSSQYNNELDYKIETLSQEIHHKCLLQQHTFEVLNSEEQPRLSYVHHTIVRFINENIIVIKPRSELLKMLVINSQIQPLVNDGQHIYVTNQYLSLVRLLIQKNMCNKYFYCSPIAYFIYWFMQTSYTPLKPNDDNQLIDQFNEQMTRYLVKFNADLLFFYSCNQLCNQGSNKNVLPLKPYDELESLKVDQIYSHNGQNSFGQLYSNNIYIVVNFTPTKNFGINKKKQKMLSYNCSYENLIEQNEFTNTILSSNRRLPQILLSLYDVSEFGDSNNNIYLTKKMRDKVNSLNLTKIPENFKNIIYQDTLLEIIEEKIIREAVMKQSKQKQSPEILTLDTSEYKSKDILVNKILSSQTNQERPKYYFIKDYQKNNVIIFNAHQQYPEDTSITISSMLFIVFQKYTEKTTLLQFLIECDTNLNNCYSLPLKKGNFKEKSLIHFINLAIKFIEKYSLNKQLFALVLRDLLKWNTNSFSYEVKTLM